jgi:glycerol-3-phosphate dehydrogenase
VNLAEAANGPAFDAVVIGGGINGCAIAEELSVRGLRVALFEATDFGFGTTWRSTKLIHGGLRYLEHGDVRLVRESLRERAWLLKTRSHLVTPQRFLLPMLPWSRRPGWQLRVGLAAYDLLAFSKAVPKHRKYGREKFEALAPYFPDVTDGGFSFYDARVHSPERLALEFALRARDQGALIANHAKVTRILAESGRVNAVEVEQDGVRHTIPARAVVNAAGPWVDSVNAHGGLPNRELLSVTRGAHIVLELDSPPGRDAVFSTAKSDGRVFFSVPQGDLLLIGTTDDRYEGDPGAIRPTADDIEYLLSEAQDLLPGLGISRDRIRYAYAGLRPLQKVKGGPEAAISRRHALVDHAENGGPRGMYSIVGGKLSTFRPLAEEVAAALGASHPRQQQEHPVAPGWANTLRQSGLSLRQKQHLRIYGAAIANVLPLGTQTICEHAGAISGEVRYVATMEEVRTLSDILMRRTGISWASCRGLCCAETVAEIASKELGWTPDEHKRQLKAFREELDFHLPTVDLLAAGAPK